MVKRLLAKEDGQVLVLTLVSATLLMAFMALAIDVGILFRARRNMQIAADAAAMAGAMQAYYGPTSSVTSAGQTAARVNGVDSAATGNTVSISYPPVDGPNTGCMSCVEARVATPNKTFFMGMFIPGMQRVAARAVAGAPSTGLACGYIMAPSADDAFWIHGAGSIIAPGCGMYVNSSQGDALCVTGKSGKSDFAWVDVVGQQGNGNCGGNIGAGTTVNLNSPVQASPWSNLPDPSNQCTGTAITPPGGTLTGTITGPGAGVVACYTNGSNPVTINNATLGPGIYVFKSGVSVTGTDYIGGTSSGTSGGATIAVSSGAFNVATTSDLNVYAPTTGTYNGVAFYQSAGDTSADLLSFGSSGSTFDGMIYAPGAQVELHDQGGSGDKTYFGFVVGTLYDNGKLDVNFTNYTSQHPTTSPFRLVTLVE
jgi:Putative Flp pilus-assembly TadE/G-like